MSSQNYARGKPMGNNQVPFYDSPPAVKAIEQYYTENGVTSSVITLTQNTTAIEIGAGKSAVLMRWVYIADAETAATSVIMSGATANWDHVIPEGQVRRFVVPIEGNYAEGQGSMVGANRANALFRRVAYKNTSIGSVFASEYGSSNSY